MEKICWQIIVAAFMQPLQYDLRSPAAKDNSITYAAKAGSNLAIPFTLREGYYSCKSQWNSIGNSSTSATCNPIYIAGTILQLQFTMEFCRPHIDETQLKPHLQCGTDPRPIRPWSDHDPTMIRPHTRPSRTRRIYLCGATGARRSRVWSDHGRIIRIMVGSVSDRFRIVNGVSTVFRLCAVDRIPLWIATVGSFPQSHLHCGKDTTVANHNGIPLATHPPAPLAIPFTLRERSHSCNSQWNSVDRT